MKGIVIGVVIGFVVATVGVTGLIGLLNQGVNTVAEHAPVIEQKINELKTYTEQFTR